MIRAEVVIIGAGPCGLFQAFELGLLGIKAHILDALPQPGGQCTQLYPDKPIYDIPALPVVTGAELTASLLRQIEPFAPEFHLGQPVQSLKQQPSGRILVITEHGLAFDCDAVVIATGAGAFRPIGLKVPGIDQFEGAQLFYSVTDRALHKGKRLVVLGGGDSALDWTLQLQPDAASLVLLHRSEHFRAQAHSVQQMRERCDAHEMQCLTGQVVDYETRDGRLSGIKVQAPDGVTRRLELDQLLVFFGLSPDVEALNSWGLELYRNQIKVDTERFASSMAAVYAVGDINWYPGKRKLILSGFHEAALAAFAIKAQLNPKKKVHTQYTTTSPLMHQRLGVQPDISDLD